ncbi:uncharacterized protein PAC_17912 [Phialocephala subalpina]|uniref:Ankyrin n=1 Tax=Phialocephala subalpina TaxID=576137 RepID=A0A1L7XSJ9_9HELO|nr:uncharacterized protein PAC_17912 [Phialocephala subalpina]
MDMVEEIPLLINALQASPLIAPIQLFSPQDLQQSDSINYELSFWDSIDWIPTDEILTDWAKSPPQLSSPMLPDAYHLTKDLPFNRFIKDLAAHGALTFLKPKQPKFFFVFTAPFAGAHSRLIQNPVQLFLTDIVSSMSETMPDNQSTSSGKQQSDVKYLLSALKSLLPNEKLQAYDGTGQSVIMEDGMVQSKLNQILLFSTANGFAGLHDIPIQSVLKYLSRYGAINFLFQGKHSRIGRALAENLFRAAIEAKDKHSLKIILAIGSVNINSTICTVNDERYTPLERVAIYQDLGTVQLMINAGADVNKTFSPMASEGGALARLFNGFRWGTNVAPDIVEIAKMLLQAGAKVHLATIKRVLQAFHLPGLAYDLISSISDADHSAFIRGGFLSLVATHLEDWQATNTFRNMIMACERTNCQRCLTGYKDKLDWAFVQSAKHGRLQLLQLLQLHCKTPHRAFSAAIRCGRKEVIDIIRSLRPDLNAPAPSIDEEEWSIGGRRPHDTTSLAEAIRAGNEELLRMIEDAGHLKHLRGGMRFQPAISAASAIGNIKYVRKLLRYYPSPEPSLMSYAVLQAVQNNDEEILFALLKAGADVNLSTSTFPHPPEPLIVAIRQQNRRMVHAILNADVDPLSGNARYQSGLMIESCSILGEAIKWGDKSIIQAILSTFPSAPLRHGHENFHVLEQSGMEFLGYLLDSGAITASALNECLEVGLRMCDAELIRTLIERGADPTDPKILEICAERHPNMLQLLLELGSLGNPLLVVPGFGTAALKAVIRCGQSGFEAVRVLLDSGVIDAKSLSSRTRFESLKETPLGLAIKWSRKGTHANFEVIRKLLDQGRCDPNSIVTYDERHGVKHTALLEAIETRDKDLKAVEVESLELVTLLLKAKADVNARPSVRGGGTALQLATITGNCNIVATLLDWGADLHASPAEINGRWPLEGAAEHGRIEMIFFLWRVNGGFDLDQCQRAMNLAEGNGYLACRDAIAELAYANKANMPAITI